MLEAGGRKRARAFEQCDFRKNRSIADHLTRFDIYIREAFAHTKSTLLPFSLIWKKAYDTTLKHGILSDLFDLDFRGYLPTFIDGFLSHRRFSIPSAHTYKTG